MKDEAAALVELLHYLRLHEYRFTTVTPKTHETVLSRAMNRRPDLRDIFGWNRLFAERDLDPALLALLDRADMIAVEGKQLKSRVRVASIGDDLFIHSAFPTDQVDAVFFGPDTYRFGRFLRQHARTVRSARVIADMGTGSAGGAIAAARLAPEAEFLLVDVNGSALEFAEVNAAAAGIAVKIIESNEVPDGIDLLIGNPPYLMDSSARTYRDGGDILGGAVGLDWISQGLKKLRPGGAILLYTGAAIVNGQSPLLQAICDECRASGARLDTDEIDPDVFGEELLKDSYAAVERIAAIGISIYL